MDRLRTFARGFGRFWYDFIVGDDPKIAAGVSVVLAAGALLVGAADASGPLLVVALAACLLVAFTVAMGIDVGRSRRSGS